MIHLERIWVVGAGAIGSVLAALLTRASARRGDPRGAGAPPPRIILVGESAHWAAVRKTGLVFECGLPAGTRVRLETATPESIPDLTDTDLVLLAGKLTRLAETLHRLSTRLAPPARLLAVQNGLGIDALVERALGRTPERGLVYFGAHVAAPGRVRYFPGRMRLRSGPAAAALARLLESELPGEVAADFRTAEWEKLAVNCIANPLAAILGVRNAVLGDASLNGLKEALLAEVRAVARAEGIELSVTVDDFNAYITGPTGGNTPSMAVDLARGEPTEIEFINGAVVSLGRRQAIAVPVNAGIADLVRFLAGKGKEAPPALPRPAGG